MKLRYVFSFASAALLVSAVAGDYRGNVGSLEAVFSLEWHDDGKVTGLYSYPSRPGVTYRLVGENPREGFLVLDEFTGNERTARCELTKTITGGEIVWAGTMVNADGRAFEMSLARARDVIPKTESETMTNDLPLVDFGNRQLPPDLDERLREAEKRAQHLAKGDGLEAHLFGELFHGWVAPGTLGYGNDPEREVPAWKERGEPVWAALRIAGGRVELQFEVPDGRREVFTGESSDDGTLRLRMGDEEWSLRSLALGDAVVWTGTTIRGPERSLLLYRPRDEIYYGSWLKMEDIAPESWLWISHSWGQSFQEKRFPFRQGEEVEAIVTRVVELAEGVSRVECRGADGKVYEAAFDSPRDIERIPAVEGMPVYLAVEGAHIRHLIGMWHVISWRGAPDRPLEFRMFPTEMADIDWSSLEPIQVNPDLYGDLPQRTLRPDFFGEIDWHCWVVWFPEEDFVAWPLPGDEGAGALELESIALQEPGADLPWNPVTRPIPFSSRQNRVGQYNATTGFGQVLPGNR